MIISEPIILFIMRTALAYKSEEQDEVPVVSTEVLESNIGGIRVELTELKTDFKEHRKEFTAAVVRLDNDIRAAVVRIDNDIKSAVAELRIEIRSMAAKAERELQSFAGRVEEQLREMRAEHIGLRDKTDKGYETLSAKIDQNHESLNAKIDKNHETLNAKIDKSHETLNAKIDKNHETLNAKIDKNHAELTGEIAAAKKEIAEVRETVTRTDSKMNALFWVIGILVGGATFVITAGQAFGWFH